MAKRRRLEVLDTAIPTDLETKSAGASSRARIPIAEVAADVAGRSALEEIAREMTAAEGEGRVVKKLPLDAVDLRHLSRDRIAFDEDEMEALTASIAARGQQTPVEVLRLDGGRYGLISGLRRIAALRALGKGEVLALVRRPETSQSAYQAMVEENEVRANLSFYERANIAMLAVEQGVYPDVRAAVKGLFAHAPKAKRSKISKFVTICEALGPALTFPAAIPEHLGFKLSQAIEADGKLAAKIRKALKATAPGTAGDERRVLEAALAKPAAAPDRQEIGPGLRLEARKGRAVLSGKAIDADFIAALKSWAKGQGG